jgi:selenocysteine lyase/cysteine desulfurase
MHCPDGWGLRPRDTGWYAAFGDLSKAQGEQVAYSQDGWRFMGATFDPSGLYRFNAVMRWLDSKGIQVATVHAHAKALQQSFLQKVAGHPAFGTSALVVPADEMRRGNFLTFETPEAQALYHDLKAQHVVSDVRGNRLRLGFGVYQTLEEVDDLVRRIEHLSTLRPSLNATAPA